MKTRSLQTFVILGILALGSSTACYAKDVSLAWDTSTNPNVTGYKIYYQADSATAPLLGTGAVQGASPISVGKITSTAITGLDSSKTHYFAVTAVDTAGKESPYSNEVIAPETIPPTVSVTAPAASATVTGTVNLTANATDNVGVSKVEFYIDNTLVGSDSASPYTISYATTSLTNGAHTLIAKAYDAAGNVGTSASVSITVFNDTTPPTVSVASPVAGSTVGGTVTATVNATDNVGVSSVSFFVDGALQGTDTSAPYTFTWNTASATNGAHTLTAMAYDAAGNSAQSTAVQITVFNDTIAPTVAITAPASSSTVTGSVKVTATATDNVGVSKVEFYINGALRASAIASPYTYTWDTTKEVNGTSAVMVKAYDAAGNVSSQSASVTVSNVKIARKKGDVNNDGVVNVADAIMLLKQVTSGAPLTTDMATYGDVAPLDSTGKPVGDGKVDISDVILVLRYAVGLVSW
ncbi:Ig-like domain-containing protein [Geobacter pickeringii]|uniref:Ig-like domain-containing protein n=1 Tax=Geobacter pickeringii TaxID=345632 RepID=UPI0006911E97|nr:Ig-like domain-containing protein [Geobacter pickeringii]